MELKDVILSTLAEMEDVEVNKKVLSSTIKAKPVVKVDKKEKSQLIKIKQKEKQTKEDDDNSIVDNEMLFLTSFKERLLVLFEGFQSPNNTNIEAKIDMTLNFLEYALATIEQRIGQIEKGKID